MRKKVKPPEGEEDRGDTGKRGRLSLGREGRAARAHVWSYEPELRGLEEAESVLSWRRYHMSRAQPVQPLPPPPLLRPITPIVFVLLLSP